MDVLDIRILQGPNYWSINHKVIVAKLDIGKYEDLPSDRIDGFLFRLEQLLPGLRDHHCSEDKPGGFLERVKTGTWIGHIVEHIALELQTVSGMPCNFGKTRSTGERGIYYVAYSFLEEGAGIYALHAAIRIAEALAQGISYNVNSDIEEIKKIVAREGLGPSTRAIVAAAKARGIPYFPLGKGSFVQLGYSCKLRRIEATTTENTSSIAVDIASDKDRTKKLLKEAAIPVPEGIFISERSELEKAIEMIGYPLVIKPNNANQGKGVSVNITDLQEAISAFLKAQAYSDGVMVEKFIPGDDFRLLIINYKLVAAARRTPAMVTGNSHSTVRELVENINQKPERGIDHENVLTRIRIDQSADEMLKKQDFTLDSIPPMGKKVVLGQTANISQGGTAEDVTKLVHPLIAEIAERAARVIGLDICGIDFIAGDISMPPKKSGAVIIEVNAAPGFRMHTNPLAGVPRPVGEAVIDMLFPAHEDGRVPVIAVTGTNGKTTTVRLLAHIARCAGFNTGFTTTEGIYVNGFRIEEGDCTGAGSARKVLSDRSVNFAVLECARGGILRTGLGFDSCDTAIVTNVAEDHLGLIGINTIEEMAKVKSVVAESVRIDGLAILNENNDLTYRMKDHLKCAIALFSIDGKSHRIADHCRRGGIAAFYNEGKIVMVNGNKILINEDIENIPVAMGGNAPFMTENILAAILAAYFNRVDTESILEGLRTFTPTFENTPGRLNRIRFRNFDLILDYAHNMHGIEALGVYIKSLHASQKTGIISAPGDRRESDIIGIGKSAAEIFDRIIIRIDEDTRDRKPAEIAELLRTGINLSRKNRIVEIIEKETDAILHACSLATKNSLIVLLSEKVDEAYEFICELKSKEERDRVENIFVPATPYVLRLGKHNIYEYTKRKPNTIRR